MENIKNIKVIKVPEDARNGSVISPNNTMYKVKKTDAEIIWLVVTWIAATSDFIIFFTSNWLTEKIQKQKNISKFPHRLSLSLKSSME